MKCPACDSSRVFPSRLRSPIERLRAMFSKKEPYRCHDCGWRKWRETRVHPDSADVHPEDLRTARVSPALAASDLDQLDTSPPAA